MKMKRTDFVLMSINELWALHLEIDVALVRKIYCGGHLCEALAQCFMPNYLANSVLSSQIWKLSEV